MLFTLYHKHVECARLFSPINDFVQAVLIQASAQQSRLFFQRVVVLNDYSRGARKDVEEEPTLSLLIPVAKLLQLLFREDLIYEPTFKLHTLNIIKNRPRC